VAKTVNFAAKLVDFASWFRGIFG